MLRKKIFTRVAQVSLAAAALLLVSGFSFADEDSSLNMSKTMYVEVSGGGMYSGIKNKFPNVTSTGWSHGNGGFAGGLDVGYQFARYFSGEAGAYYFQEVKAPIAPGQGPLDIYSIAGYVAAKMVLPLNNYFAIFAKAGFGYQYYRLSNSPAFNKDNHEFNPMFAAGFSVFPKQGNVNIAVTYVHFNGSIKQNGIGDPSEFFNNPDLFLLGVGYHFSL